MVVSSIDRISDVQLAQAQRFVNADERAISRLADKNYEGKYKQSDKNFGKAMNAVAVALPALGFASGLAKGRSIAGSLKIAAHWAGFLIAGKLVTKGLSSAEEHSSKVRKAEKKYPVMTTLAKASAVLGVAWGADVGINKLAQNETVGRKVKGKILDALLCSEIVKNNVSDMASRVGNHIPKGIKDGFNKVMGSEIAETAMKAGKSAGSYVLRHAPDIAIIGAFAALVGKSASMTRNYNDERARIKYAQFETAKELTNYYSKENEELKSQLDFVSSSVM